MMGPRLEAQSALFYDFPIDGHVPVDHVLRAIDGVPDHSTFSKNRHSRFRDRDVLRHVFETVVAQCIEAGLASGQRYAADASIIAADAIRQKSTPKGD